MQAPPSPLSRTKTAGFVALIFAVVLACYWPALSGAMLWDDPAHVPHPELRSVAGLKRIWFELGATQQYYPVLFSAFWLEHRLWGDAMLGYHLVNVVFHAASCCVLAFLLRRLWSPPAFAPSAGPAPGFVVPAGAAALAALLFAVHPICVESVAWITEQKNTLSLLCYLLAALTYVEYRQRRRAWWYALASGFFLLALGSKTVTVTLPAALLVVSWWQRGRLTWREDVLPLLPWFAASATIGLLTSWVERKFIGAEGGGFELSLVERALLAGRVIWFYAGKLAWPTNLMFFYPRWTPAAPHAARQHRPRRRAGRDGLALDAAAAHPRTARGLAAVRRRARPGAGIFQRLLFPVSYVNDHFVYLACLGPLALATAGIATGLAAVPDWIRPAGRIGSAVLVLALAALSFRQSGLYRGNEILFRHAIARNPETWMGHYILGFALAKTPAGRAEALDQFQETLRLNPAYPDAHLSLAIELARMPGRSAEAIGHYEQALALRPHYLEAHNALGVELAKIPGRVPEAVAHYETALELNPNYAEAHYNLANALAGNPVRAADALSHYQESPSAEPRFRPRPRRTGLLSLPPARPR